MGACRFTLRVQPQGVEKRQGRGEDEVGHYSAEAAVESEQSQQLNLIIGLCESITLQYH